MLRLPENVIDEIKKLNVLGLSVEDIVFNLRKTFKAGLDDWSDEELAAEINDIIYPCRCRSPCGKTALSARSTPVPS